MAHCSLCRSPVPIANATIQRSGSATTYKNAACSCSVRTVDNSSVRADRARGIRRAWNGLASSTSASHASVNAVRSRFKAFRHVFAASGLPVLFFATNKSCNHSRAIGSVTRRSGSVAMACPATCLDHRRRSSATCRYPPSSRSRSHSAPHSLTVNSDALASIGWAVVFVFSFTSVAPRGPDPGDSTHAGSFSFLHAWTSESKEKRTYRCRMGKSLQIV